MTHAPVVVFSDLDGTLLDHQSYDWTPAVPTLQRLRVAGIPMVLASSKTAAEMVPLRAAMGLAQAPVIYENGAGVVPGGCDALPDRAAYHALRAALNTLPDALRQRFEGFGDMTGARIAAATGLTGGAADRAARRSHTEPGMWHGTEAALRQFVDALADRGLHAVRGGRFVTLGAGADKADRMAEVARAVGAGAILALGDAPNDARMLSAADVAVVVANPAAPCVTGLTAGHVYRTVATGPVGWAEGIAHALEHTGLDPERG